MIRSYFLYVWNVLLVLFSFQFNRRASRGLQLGSQKRNSIEYSASDELRFAAICRLIRKQPCALNKSIISLTDTSKNEDKSSHTKGHVLVDCRESISSRTGFWHWKVFWPQLIIFSLCRHRLCKYEQVVIYNIHRSTENLLKRLISFH